MALHYTWRIACRRIVASIALLFCAAASAGPIELIVPYAAGGYTDALARRLADALSQRWGEPVIVVNKAGAASRIGTRYVIEQGSADGRTLLLGSFGFVTSQLSARGAPFDPKALAPVIHLGGTPSVLYVSASLPVNSYADFVAWARRQPKGVAFGNSGTASSPHLNAEELASREGFNSLAVSYAGASASIPAAAGGHIDAVFESSAARSVVAAGKLKALFVGSDQPLPTWPEVPTAEKAGLPGFRSGSWFGLFVPARTTAAVVNRLNADINSALASPALAAQLRAMDFQTTGGSPDAFARFLDAERSRLRQLIGQRHIDVE